MTIQTAVDWQNWLQRWDNQQTGYLPDREERRRELELTLQIAEDRANPEND